MIQLLFLGLKQKKTVKTIMAEYKGKSRKLVPAGKEALKRKARLSRAVKIIIDRYTIKTGQESV